jgi:hypothetical protein
LCRIESDAVLETPFRAAVIVALDGFFVFFVLTVNVCDAAPSAKTTLAGTVASDVLELVRFTVAPPAGAAAESVTVPVDVPPPTTVVGLSESVESATGGGGGTGFSVSTVCLVTPL